METQIKGITTSKLRDYRWKYLPYGFWTENDGAVVILTEDMSQFGEKDQLTGVH